MDVPEESPVAVVGELVTPDPPLVAGLAVPDPSTFEVADMVLAPSSLVSLPPSSPQPAARPNVETARNVGTRSRGMRSEAMHRS
jgi:hypothetical protein